MPYFSDVSWFFPMFVQVKNGTEEVFVPEQLHHSWSSLRRSWSEVSGAGSVRSTGRGRRSSDSELPSTIFSRKFSPEGAPIGPSCVSGAIDGAIHLRKPKRRVSFSSGDFEKGKVERGEMEPPHSKTAGLRILGTVE